MTTQERKCDYDEGVADLWRQVEIPWFLGEGSSIAKSWTSKISKSIMKACNPSFLTWLHELFIPHGFNGIAIYIAPAWSRVISLNRIITFLPFRTISFLLPLALSPERLPCWPTDVQVLRHHPWRPQDHLNAQHISSDKPLKGPWGFSFLAYHLHTTSSATNKPLIQLSLLLRAPLLIVM